MYGKEKHNKINHHRLTNVYLYKNFVSVIMFTNQEIYNMNQLFNLTKTNN